MICVKVEIVAAQDGVKARRTIGGGFYIKALSVANPASNNEMSIALGTKERPFCRFAGLAKHVNVG